MCFRPTGITTTSSPPFLPASLDNNTIPLPFPGERDGSFWQYGVSRSNPVITTHPKLLQIILWTHILFLVFMGCLRNHL